MLNNKFDFNTFQRGYTTKLTNLNALDTINMLLNVAIQYVDKDLYLSKFNLDIDALISTVLAAGTKHSRASKSLFQKFLIAHATDKFETMINNLNLNEEDRELLKKESHNIGSLLNTLLMGDPSLRTKGVMEVKAVELFNIFRTCLRKLKNTPADQRNKFLQKPTAEEAATEAARKAAAEAAAQEEAAREEAAREEAAHEAIVEKLLKELYEAHKSANKEVKKAVLFANKDLVRGFSANFRAATAEEKESAVEEIANVIKEEKQTVAELINVINAADKIESAKEGNTVTVDSTEEAREIAEQGGILDVAKTVSLKDSETVSNVIHQNNVEANNAIVKRGWC